VGVGVQDDGDVGVPEVTAVEPNPDGSGEFVESRRKTGPMPTQATAVAAYQLQDPGGASTGCSTRCSALAPCFAAISSSGSMDAYSTAISTNQPP
jgi:hypothetical protein